MEVRFFNPGKWFLEHEGEVMDEIQRVLAAGDLILRKDLDTFEENLAKFVGKKHAIGVNSGTDALYLSLWALGIGPGDEVIVPSHTFVASVQVVEQLGATPVLIDCADNLLMQQNIQLTPRTKAIIPVHLTGDVVRTYAGFVDDMNKKGIHIVEDAAQALGAQGLGYGITQCWSFYPAKILGAYGDAGAITTDDDKLADDLRQLRHHWKRDYSKWGINSRLDNIQAVVLNIKMKYLGESLAKRTQIAQIYLESLNDTPLRLPEDNEYRVWQDFVIRARSEEEREALYNFLKLHGIETMVNEYPMPIEKLPNSLKIEHETLRIPCNDVLEPAEVEYVISTIKKFYEKA